MLLTTSSVSGRLGANPEAHREQRVRRPCGAAWCRKRERFGLAEGREVCFFRFEDKEIKTKPHHIPGTFVEEG